LPREPVPLEDGPRGARATLEEAKLDTESIGRAGFLDQNRADVRAT